jgi:hypothetical protein
MSHFGWKRFKSSGRLVHSDCIEAYNSTIMCGLDHGSCRDRACSMSDDYNEEYSKAFAGKLPLTRGIREALANPKVMVEVTGYDSGGHELFTERMTLDVALSTYQDIESQWELKGSYWEAWREPRENSEMGSYTLEVK